MASTFWVDIDFKPWVMNVVWTQPRVTNSIVQTLDSLSSHRIATHWLAIAPSSSIHVCFGDRRRTRKVLIITGTGYATSTVRPAASSRGSSSCVLRRSRPSTSSSKISKRPLSQPCCMLRFFPLLLLWVVWPFGWGLLLQQM